MNRFTPDDLPRLHAMQEQAERIKAMIYRRAVEAYFAAFDDFPPHGASLNGCILHNSLVGLETGRPWQEVNYQHMRRARWLLEKSLEPGRIVNNWYRRKCGLAPQ